MEKNTTPRVVEIVDVYRRKCRMNRDDYEGSRTQLRLYTKRGTPYQYVSGFRESTTIHRDNIAVIDGETVRPFA
jgi:hypothetical protein